MPAQGIDRLGSHEVLELCHPFAKLTTIHSFLCCRVLLLTSSFRGIEWIFNNEYEIKRLENNGASLQALLALSTYL
jgi:hypothetical protein